jgi:Na+/H+ antiporter NhaD/arsenite permease-like protein
MLPILKSASSDLLWLSLASAATLAGNATIIGAVANLIVIEVAKKYDIEIGFWQFFKVGFLITMITLLLSILILYLQLNWSML